MTPEQLAAVKVGDRVRYDKREGRVAQDAPTWFMITWDDSDTPEIVKRTGFFARFMELET